MTEKQIREALVSHLSATPKGAKAAFISELFLDGFSRRADLVMANGRLTVFEIKSSRDSLDRLEGQLKSYIRFFEQVTVVCAEKHLHGVLMLTPKIVGIWVAKENGGLKIVRRAKTQTLPSRGSWLSFLPVDEIKLLLRRKGIKATGTRTDLLEASELIPQRLIREYVLDYLKRRDKRIQALVGKRTAKRAQALSSGPTAIKSLEAFLQNTHTHITATPRLTNYSSKPSCSSS